MIELTLSILILILIGLGLLEAHYHRLALAQLPIRIHVNGSRGKSSVTRLIASGLRAGGLKTLAKTTGTSPRIIDENGKDRVIHRLRSASIGEQVRLVRNFSRKKPDAVVFECMAVNPQYQWVVEQKMIKSTISVLTNVRPDHVDEMGSTLRDNALSLSNTIPFKGQLATSEQNMGGIIAKVAESRATSYNQVDSESVSQSYMDKFSYLEHRDNVALALEVCKMCGTDEKTALEGMLKASPDPGATIIWKLDCQGNYNHFVNLLAANDPSSTFNAFQQLQTRIGNSPICIFLNTREDRRYRTNQLINLVFNKIKPNVLIVRGENLPAQFYNYQQENHNIIIHQLPNSVGIKELMSEFSNLDEYYIVGIGNMVGWGEELVYHLKEYRV